MFACLARVSGDVSAATSRSTSGLTSRPTSSSALQSTSREGEAAFASLQAVAGAAAAGNAEAGAEAGVEIAGEALAQLAADFSPRFEQLHDAVMLIDVSGLGRVIGPPTEVARELARAAQARGLRLAVAIAATRTAATLLALHAATRSAATASVAAPATRAPAKIAQARIASVQDATAQAASIDAHADIIVVPAGEEAQALAVLPVSLLAHVPGERMGDEPASSGAATGAAAGAASSAASGASVGRGRGRGRGGSRMGDQANAAYGRTRGKRTRGSGRNYRLAPAPGEARAEAIALLDTLRRWGIQTLGELLRLPGASLFERFGPASFWLRQVARGIDARPLVPSIAEEAFEATLALEWPLDNLEPLAFVLGQIVDPLCVRLEQRDRGAVIVHVALRLVTKIIETRRIELPAPMRDAKVLRTLVLLDLESHPPGAGIDSVTIRFDVTPGRIVQHSLLTRALPSPEQLSTLLARLTAVMGEGRVGAPALIDSHRPEAFALRRFNPPVMADPSAGSANNGTHSGANNGANSSPNSGASNGPNGGAKSRANGGVRGVSTRSSDEVTSRAIDCVAGGWRGASGTSLRRFRRPLPIDVRLQDGRPVHLAAVRGVRGGRIVQAAGPWRSSGQWWQPPAGALAAIVSTMTGMSTEAPRPLSASTPAPPAVPPDAPITASQSARKVLSKPLPGSAEAGARQGRKGGARGATEVRGAKTGAVVSGASAAGAASGVGAGAAPDAPVAAEAKAHAKANVHAEGGAAAEAEAGADTGAQPGAFTRAWVRDEWDIVLSGGELCRIYYDGVRHQWMLASIID